MNNRIKTKYSKEELITIVQECFSEKPRPMSHDEITDFLEEELCKYVNALIDIRRKGLKNLSFLDKTKTVAILNGELIKGCSICLSSGLIPLKTSTKCQLQCDFCTDVIATNLLTNETNLDTLPLSKNQVIFSGLKHSLDSFKVFLTKQSSLHKGIAWVSRGEPLLELDKIKELMPVISKLGIYQWIYTNGVLLDEDTLKLLVDCGLNELRINLQASNFSEDIIKKLELCKKYFDLLVIESPMYSLSFPNFIKYTPILIDSGVVQINTPELQIFQNTLDRFYDTEGLLYRYNKGSVSPISSVLFIYDYLNICEDKNWKVVVNTCANSNKFYRGCSDKIIGSIDYNTFMKFLPFHSYLFIIDKYFSNSGNSEWEVF
jgi:hypothetical protein